MGAVNLGQRVSHACFRAGNVRQAALASESYTAPMNLIQRSAVSEGEVVGDGGGGFVAERMVT